MYQYNYCLFSLDRQVSAAAAELCIIWLFAKYDIMIVVMKEFEKKLMIYFTVSSFESPSIFVMSSPVSLLDDNFPLINFDRRFNFTAEIRKTLTERSEITPTQAAAQGWWKIALLRPESFGWI